MCLTFGLFFFVVAMAVLVIDESLLDFGLDSGNTSVKLISFYVINLHFLVSVVESKAAISRLAARML